MPRTKVVSKIAHESCMRAPRRDLSPAWWRRLENNFARRPEGFELKLTDRALVSASAAVDLAVRTFMASAVSVLTLPLGYHPWTLADMRRDRTFYSRLLDESDASAFFRPPGRRVAVHARQVRWTPFMPKGCICEDLTFESPFIPANPRVRDDYAAQVANRTAHARLWRHDDGPRPTLMAIHGFGAEKSWMNEFILTLPRFFGLGCDVMLLTLPFHGPRAGLLSPFSGHGIFSGGISRINESFAQAVHDARLFINHLFEDRGVPRVGVTGISLGGYTASLLAACEPRLSFSIPNVPVVSMADLILEWQPLSTLIRTILVAAGLSIKDLRHTLAISSPLTYQPALPREQLMIVGGVGDRMAPPKHARLLWDHWERCRLHWFPGGHLVHLDKGEYLVEMSRFLRTIGFL